MTKLEDTLDLLVGGTVILMPAFILAVPCVVLCVFPLLVVGAVAGVVGGVVAAPVLVTRKLVRWRRGMT